MTVFCVAAWPLFAWGCARALVSSDEVAHADAIVVLSGSADYVERARRAAQLFGEGRAPRVVLTDDGKRGGWSNAEERNPFFVELAAAELQRLGVPRERIEVLTPVVSGTYQECVVLRDRATSGGLRSLLVVTSGYHSRRALWTLRRVFRTSNIKIALMPAAPGQESPSPLSWWLSARGWKAVATEYPKLAYYWLRYR